MTKPDKTRPTIRSKQPCPVCGSQKWHPLVHMRDYTLEDTSAVNAATWAAQIDVANPEAGVDGKPLEVYDECAKCGTVVC